MFAKPRVTAMRIHQKFPTFLYFSVLIIIKSTFWRISIPIHLKYSSRFQRCARVRRLCEACVANVKYERRRINILQGSSYISTRWRTPGYQTEHCIGIRIRRNRKDHARAARRSSERNDWKEIATPRRPNSPILDVPFHTIANQSYLGDPRQHGDRTAEIARADAECRTLGARDWQHAAARAHRNRYERYIRSVPRKSARCNEPRHVFSRQLSRDCPLLMSRSSRSPEIACQSPIDVHII